VIRPDPQRRVLLVLCVVTALCLRVWGIWFGLPFLHARPDEEKIVDIAVNMWRAGPNPHFFNYPTAFIYVIAVAARLAIAIGQWIGVVGAGGFTAAAAQHISAIYLMDRVIVAVLGTATVLLIFRVARRLFDEDVALVAAAFAATAFLLVRDGHFGVTDVPLAFMITLAFGAIVSRPLDSRHWASVVGAAALCGLAASTKYNALLLCVPLAIAIVRAERRVSGRLDSTFRVLVVAGVCAAMGFFVATPYALLDFHVFRMDVAGEARHLRDGHGVMLGRGWAHHLTFSLPYGVGWPVMLLALTGAVVVTFRDWQRALVLLAFPVLYYLGIGSGLTVFMRYVIPMLPFVCVLAAAGLLAIVRQLPPSPLARAAAAGALLLAAVLPNVVRSVETDRVLSGTDTRVLAATALIAAHPHGASIYENHRGDAIWPMLPPEFRHVEEIGVTLPDVVVITTSPLTYYTPPASAADRQLLARGYQLETTFDPGFTGTPEQLAYDQQDAFFVPVSGLGDVRRPGPMIEIYALTAR
jgi:4-amino-4-deoxy-L-arabinose transferase-like glycosyltransferase